MPASYARRQGLQGRVLLLAVLGRVQHLPGRQDLLPHGEAGLDYLPVCSLVGHVAQRIVFPCLGEGLGHFRRIDGLDVDLSFCPWPNIDFLAGRDLEFGAQGIAQFIVRIAVLRADLQGLTVLLQGPVEIAFVEQHDPFLGLRVRCLDCQLVVALNLEVHFENLRGNSGAVRGDI